MKESHKYFDELRRTSKFTENDPESSPINNVNKFKAKLGKVRAIIILLALPMLHKFCDHV